MQVKDAMTTDVELASPTHTIRQAALLMEKTDCGVLPVADKDSLVGMITDRDIAVRGIAKGYGPETPVRELMTDDLIVVRIDDDVEEAATKMSDARVRRLPVIDSDERLCGIVSLGDLARESDDECSQQALEGVSQPGGQHQQ